MSYDNDDNNVYNVDLQQADNLLPQNQLLTTNGYDGR